MPTMALKSGTVACNQVRKPENLYEKLSSNFWATQYCPSWALGPVSETLPGSVDDSFSKCGSQHQHLEKEFKLPSQKIVNVELLTSTHHDEMIISRS